MNSTLKWTAVLAIATLLACSKAEQKKQKPVSPAEYTQKDGQITSMSGSFQISGVYPHLTTYSHARVNETQSYYNEPQGQRECGIGALAEWNGKLYMVNYAAHEPQGSEHKLYIINKDLTMRIFQESVGGTPAGRMVHHESDQLFIGHYAVNANDSIRVIDISEMPGRMTAIARHLKAPAEKVYYYDMEGMLYEVDVNTLRPELLFENPLPGWHGKGAYTAQNRLVLANNGEAGGSFEPTEHWKVDTIGIYGPEKKGVLAAYDSEDFSVVERKQYTDVTTKHGIHAVPNDQSPLWSMGWDKRAVRLKVLEKGNWHTFLLPKATYNNDPTHGWFTEWPRIREIHNGKFMMDMHGMFYDFPPTFSASNTAGLKPISSHLRYIPDFMHWNGKIVLATDETSIQGNPLAGQPQSNLWFGKYSELANWGPATGYGAIWLKDSVKARQASLPYLFNGFDQRMLHVVNHSNKPVKVNMQVDKSGNRRWENFKSLTIPANAYRYHIFDENLQAEWLRLIPETKGVLTASLHYTDENLHDPTPEKTLFQGLAASNYSGKVSHAKLYSNHDNFNLTLFEGEIENGQFKNPQAWELDKFDFTFSKGTADTTAEKVLENEVIWSEDAASVLLHTPQDTLRLPRGRGSYSPRAMRNLRELESERLMANIHGTFYEVPLLRVGEPPRYSMLRPVATHNRQISDYNTWNGLLAISGVRLDQTQSRHIFTHKNGEVAIWLGAIDDLWQLGKPRGKGGVWKNTKVQAGERSHKFLMTGYDQKSVTLKANQDVAITLYIYTNHYLDQAVPYKTFQLKAGEKRTHQFPEGFSAHWIAAEANKDCEATVWFTYR